MGLKVGIIGLPNVGKSTLFNAIMGRQAALTAPYPFATVEPNIGVVDVPDERLLKLHAALERNPHSGVTAETPIVRTAITFVDIAGLVKGAAKGQGLGNQFLSHIRDVDVIVHVLREFDPSPDSGQGIPRHPDSKNPEHDAKIVETELGLKDLEVSEKERSKKSDRLMDKPMIYAINVGEEKLQQLQSSIDSGGETRIVERRALGVNENPSQPPDETGFATVIDKPIFYFSATLEEQIAQLPKDEQQEFLSAYNLQESGLDRIIEQCYRLLGLISFFTVGKIEVRAWPVKRGATAPQAAAVIHSDFERLFIRGEMIDWKKMCEAGSWQEAKEKGWVRTEGKDYVMVDGEVCNFLIGK